MKFILTIATLLCFSAQAATNVVKISGMFYNDGNTSYNDLAYTRGIDPTLWSDGFLRETITLETTANISGDAIVVVFNFPLNVGDKIVLSVNNGASFANANLTLEQSKGGAGNGDLTYAVLQNAPVDGDSSITFVMKESDSGSSPDALSDTGIFILSGDTIAGQSIDFNLPAISNNKGWDIYLTATILDSSNNVRAKSPAKLTYETTLAHVPSTPFKW